jgi:hypothetical protein
MMILTIINTALIVYLYVGVVLFMRRYSNHIENHKTLDKK